MDQPAQTINVKVLDPNYQTVSTGTLGTTLDPNDKPAATCLLTLSGGIEVDNMELKGVYNYFIESLAGGTMMMMGGNIMLVGESNGDQLIIMCTAWGDGAEMLLGYFFFGEQAPIGGKPYIITT
jgi:hypothetical protein